MMGGWELEEDSKLETGSYGEFSEGSGTGATSY